MKTKIIELKPDTEIIEATQGRFGRHPLKHILDSGYGQTVWVYGEEFGPCMLVTGVKGICAALEAVYDELPTIPVDELPEAYGFDGWDSAGERTETVYSPETAKARFEARIEAARAGKREYPELIEGYHYQSNSSGTGIVSVSDYEWIRELKTSDLEEWGINLQIRRVA